MTQRNTGPPLGLSRKKKTEYYFDPRYCECGGLIHRKIVLGNSDPYLQCEECKQIWRISGDDLAPNGRDQNAQLPKHSWLLRRNALEPVPRSLSSIIAVILGQATPWSGDPKIVHQLSVESHLRGNDNEKHSGSVLFRCYLDSSSVSFTVLSLPFDCTFRSIVSLTLYCWISESKL